ncbi:MAG: lysophospholipase [Oculatellaceae cyanobacterium Prado106]|jgi:pimeloyl-ACP methyl ester carboxylesterase|nr:lysophospholipase [Oculatellaceae cyanobacterium Prado106]
MEKVHQSLRFKLIEKVQPDAPLLIYLPGMDGTGDLFHRQIGSLTGWFDVRCLVIPVDDLRSWEELTAGVVSLVKQELQRYPRPAVYLLGESFGGCLALQVILQAPQLFDRLILSNPASAFNRHPLLYWGSYLVQPQPEVLYRWSCVSFVPFLAALERIEPDDRKALLKAMQSVSQEASVWRLSLLRELQLSDRQLASIEQPTLLMASGGDRIFPSIAEAERLADQIPTTQRHILPRSGHACLLERDVNLYSILQKQDFLEPAALTQVQAKR